MTDNIVQFTGTTILPDTSESVLEKAKQWGLSKVMVVGLSEDNDLLFGGSFSEAGDMLLVLEWAKKAILDTL